MKRKGSSSTPNSPPAPQLAWLLIFVSSSNKSFEFDGSEQEFSTIYRKRWTVISMMLKSTRRMSRQQNKL